MLQVRSVFYQQTRNVLTVQELAVYERCDGLNQRGKRNGCSSPLVLFSPGSLRTKHTGIPALSIVTKVRKHMHKTYYFVRAVREPRTFWAGSCQPDGRIQTPDICSPVAEMPCSRGNSANALYGSTIANSCPCCIHWKIVHSMGALLLPDGYTRVEIIHACCRWQLSKLSMILVSAHGTGFVLDRLTYSGS
jgi:hypothetical protein